MKLIDAPMPKAVHKPEGSVDMRAFQADYAGDYFGIIYAREPDPTTGLLRIHVTISKSRDGRQVKLSSDDLDSIENAILNVGLAWPAEYEVHPFTAGPFAGAGLHIWQKWV